MRTLIVAPERAERMLCRLAYEVVERNRGTEDIVLLGILNSGLPVANAIARHMGTVKGGAFPVIPLDTRPFRDDCPDVEEVPASGIPDLTGKRVILIDDVLFTGRTARAALDAVMHFGRPSCVQLLVLVDRGHREVPIQADYTGRILPTKHRERVNVDTGGDYSVFVVE